MKASELKPGQLVGYFPTDRDDHGIYEVVFLEERNRNLPGGTFTEYMPHIKRKANSVVFPVHGSSLMPLDEVQCCPECGSVMIDQKTWKSVNSGVGRDEYSEDVYVCCDCDADLTELITYEEYLAINPGSNNG